MDAITSWALLWVLLRQGVVEKVEWRGNAEEERERREKDGFTLKYLWSAAISSCFFVHICFERDFDSPLKS